MSPSISPTADAWADFIPGRATSLSDGVGKALGSQIVGRLLDSGYNFDFFDDGMLDRFGKVDNGTLKFGNVKYRAVVLAGVERISPIHMQKLEAFAKAGGIVVATRRLPAIAPVTKPPMKIKKPSPIFRKDSSPTQTPRHLRTG